MESVDVLARVDRPDHSRLVDVPWGRGLHEDAVDCRVGVETGDEAEQLFLRGGGGEFEFARIHAELAAGLVLAADIGPRGGMVAEEDHGETRRDAPGPQPGNVVRRRGMTAGGNGFSVDKGCHSSSVNRLRPAKPIRFSGVRPKMRPRLRSRARTRADRE